MVNSNEQQTVTLKRLSQVAAVASSNRLEDTLDWLLPMLCYYLSGPWRSPDDWQQEIRDSYGIEVSLHDLSQSLGRLVTKKVIVKDFQGNYSLSTQSSKHVETELEHAADLEEQVKSEWLALTKGLLPADRSDQQSWQMLMDYCAPVFRAHGADAIELLAGKTPLGEINKQDELLRTTLARHGVSSADQPNVALAISTFFNSGSGVVNQYIAHLADSTYNLLALCVDEETRETLRERVPELRIFLDTNILFSILGTHDTPLAAASIDLFRVIREAELPFKLYYHEKTLTELTHTLEDATHRLRSRPWSQHISRAAVQLPWQLSRLSGIEMKFHQINAVKPTDPHAYCSRFDSPVALLAEFGLKVYRDAVSQVSNDRQELKATILADYKSYLDKYPRRKNSPYEKLDHDCSVWMTAKDHQTPTTKKGSIFSGSFFLSSDYVLWRFDKEVMRKSYQTKPVVVLPDALLQALRPFIGGDQFDDNAYVRAFSASELRATAGVSDNAATVRRVLGYLAAFEDLSEETSLHILSDNILMQGLRKYEVSAPEFSEAISNAIFAHNESLLLERNALLSERNEQLGLAERALSNISDNDSHARSVIQDLIESLKLNVEGDLIVNHHHGDTFNNRDSQVGAQGRNASSRENTLSQSSYRLEDSAELRAELVQLKDLLASRATNSDDYEVVSVVQGAVEAIDSENDTKAAGLLRRAGQKALDAAIEIGAKVATAAIQAQIGG